VLPAPLTGVGAIRRFLAFVSSCSDSLTPPGSRLPSAPLLDPATPEPVPLWFEAGVIGGVVNGKPLVELVAVTLGTVPSVGVGEFATMATFCT